MNKFEMLKQVVSTLHYPKHKDIPVDERRLLDELERENYLVVIGNSYRPTEKGMKAVKFISFEDYKSSLVQGKSIVNNNTINGGFVKVYNENNLDSSKNEQKKENLFSKIITWLVTLFKKQI